MSATETFVSERITPDPAALEIAGTASGEPALPRHFRWRKQQFAIREVLETWKDHGDCRHGSGERYLRKHWFLVRTNDGSKMRLYFERQPQSRRAVKARWWIYSIETKE